MATLKKTSEEIKIAGVISIPESKVRKDDGGFSSAKYETCPCCGKEMKNPKYGFNSIYGGEAYPQNGPDPETIEDAWVMTVGSECRKLFPAGYVFKLK